MKLLFSAFPDGLAGIALLLLRVSLALFLVATAPATLPSQPWVPFALGIVAIALLAGFLTRILSALCVLGAAIVLLDAGWAVPMPYANQMIDAAALAMIGPGAMSVDSWMFGRRTFQLPG